MGAAPGSNGRPDPGAPGAVPPSTPPTSSSGTPASGSARTAPPAHDAGTPRGSSRSFPKKHRRHETKDARRRRVDRELARRREQDREAELAIRYSRGINAVDRAVKTAAANAVGRFLRQGAPPAWLRAPEPRP